MTNDTKIAIGWQAVEIESAFVVRHLFKRKSPYAPEITGISRTLSVQQIIPPDQFLGFRVRRSRRTYTAALLSANPESDPEKARDRSRCQPRYRHSRRARRDTNFTPGVRGPLPTAAGCRPA